MCFFFFSAFIFVAFCCFLLPLAVDYTSYGRGLPTRVFRMFEFSITPAWSCRNSAGCERVGDSFSRRRFIILFSAQDRPRLRWREATTPPSSHGCWIDFERVDNYDVLIFYFQQSGRAIRRRSWSLKDAVSRRSWTSSTPCFAPQPGFFSCIFFYGFSAKSQLY